MWEKFFPKSFENYKIFGLGLEAYKIGDFKGAVKFFRRIIEREPDFPHAWYMSLESLSYLAYWEDMVVLGEKAIEIHPNYGLTYSWLGDAYNQLGNREQALASYKKALNLLEKELSLIENKQERKTIFDSINAEKTLLNSLGEINNRLGNYEEAIKYNQKSSNIHPDEHNLHGLGTSYKEMGEYDKAIEFYKKSLDINPKHSYAWFDLGLIYENSNDSKKAIECYEKAVESSPQWVKLREKLLKVKPDSL
ncbi:MAG: tetratricopeptide repeat protein, partial [Promethearchaeota archaeon]